MLLPRKRDARPFPAVAAVAAAVIGAAGLGCGGGSGGKPGDRGGQAGEPSLLAPDPASPALAGQVVVAEVNGVPIHDGCPRTQIASGLATSKDEALAQCIDFELLAQAAQTRPEVRDHPDIALAARTETVRRFMDEEFIARYPDVDHLDHASLLAAYKTFDRRFHRPEYRHTIYVRAPAKDVPAGAPADVEAKKLADEIYAELGERRDLDTQTLGVTAARIAGERKVEIGQPFDFPRRGRAVEPFAAAAFAIPEPGMISPPTRTRWGWDIILLTKISPVVDISLEQAKEELFTYVRRQKYIAWVSEFGKKARVQVDEAALQRLQEAEDARRFATRESP